MNRTGVTLRRILGDWRLYLAFALLTGLLWLGLTFNMKAGYRYKTFLTLASEAVHPNQIARSLGLEGQYETVEQVWETYVDDPDRAEYYTLAILCNASFTGTLAAVFFSFWLVARSIDGGHASALLLRGASRAAVFRQLLCPCLGLTLLFRWGFFALCFAVMPVHTEYFPAPYLRGVVPVWLLLSAADTAFFSVAAFALPPAAAGAADMGAAALVLCLPRELGRLAPLTALTDKALWKPSAFPGVLIAAAVAGGAVLLASLAAAWLLFRRRELP